MTTHRLLNILAGIVLAGVIAAALAASHLLDGPDDNHAEWDQAAALQMAQKAAQIEARMERAAAQLCMKLKGPNSGHRWDVDNKLHCTDNRGRSVAAGSN